MTRDEHTGDTGEIGDAAVDEPHGGGGAGRPPGRFWVRSLPGWSSWSRWEFFAFLELFALCGFVFAQPVLDATSESPEFFLFHRAGTADILVMVAVFTVGPPLALWLLGALTRLAGRRTRAGAQVLLVGGLIAAFVIQVGKPIAPLRGVTLGVIAAAAAAGLVIAYVRLRVARSVLRMAAVGPLVFALLFVFVSPVSSVVLVDGEQDTELAEVTGEHPPVVVLLLDEFPLKSLLGPDGRIDAARYPNFAALAGESTWYRNATTVNAFTPYSIPTLLTGRYPPDEGVAPHYIEFPDNLFTLFDQAYEVNALESVTRMCTPMVCDEIDAANRSGLGGVLRDSTMLLTDVVSPDDNDRDMAAAYREPTLRERAELERGPHFRLNRVRENQPVRFHEFIQQLQDYAPDAAEPPLHFLHLLVPHGPMQYLASGARYELRPELGQSAHILPDGGEPWRDWWLHLIWQRHMQQVQYADLLLGETVRVMRESGLYDDALFVLTSDHGVSFTPGASGRGLDPEYVGVPEVLWVPTFVKAPNQTDGAIDDRNWEQVDLLPTMADHAGFEVPWETDGRSAREQPRERAEKHFFVDSGGLRLTIDAPEHFAALLDNPPPQPAPPGRQLLGRPVDQLPVSGVGPAASVTNLDEFAGVDLAGGTVPALVHGRLSEQVTEGSLVAIAVNGRIGAVVPAIDHEDGGRWFVGLVTDDQLFTDGDNQVELFAVGEDGTSLTPLPIQPD